MINRVFWENIAEHWSKKGITVVPDVEIPLIIDDIDDDEDEDIDDILSDILS